MKNTIIVLMGLLAGAAVAAETATLADPTRPPGALSGGGVAIDGGEEAARLQSVLMPKGGKPMAIISGQVVRLGEKIGEARLVRLSENEAVLRGPRGVERLFLVSDVSKRNEVLKAAAVDNEKRNKP